MDVSKYCMIVVVGGDGTVHEVANGLIARTDGKRTPICPIPNGSGDDFCASIGITCVEDAL
jgi:diacylglycerol kinase family enzyme